MSNETISQMIERYENMIKEELHKSFPFDFGVVESMQKIDDYKMFIDDLKQLRARTLRRIELG